MSKPVRPAPPIVVGTTSQAEKIIEGYADLEGLTLEECRDVGFDEDHARLLMRVLGEAKDGVVTSAERDLIWNSGFSGEFLYALAGQDSQKGQESTMALKRRVAWLADHAGTGFFRRDTLERRVEAIKKLGTMGIYARSTVPKLTQLLEDNEREIRQAAAGALGEIGGFTNGAATSLVEKLRSWPSQDRPVLVEALSRIGSDAIVPLIFALDDGEPRVLQLVFELLGRIGPAARGAVPRVIQILQNKASPWQLQNEAAVTLGNLRDARAIPALIETLESGNELVARAAAWALVKIGPDVLLPLVARLRTLQDKKPDPRSDEARRQAAWALGMRHPDNDAVTSALAASLDDPAVQYEASTALVRIGGPALVDLLTQLSTPNTVARRYAVWALGEIGARTPLPDLAIEELQIALHDDDELVQLKAAEAIKKIGVAARIVAPDLVELLGHPSEYVRKAAAAALVPLGEAAAIPLAKALGTQDPVGRTAYELLVAIGAPSVPPLVAMVTGDRPGPVESAVQALIQIGPPSVASVVTLTVHPKAEVRERAVRILGEIVPVDKTAVAAVFARLERETEPSVQQAAVNGLAKMGKPAMPKVIEASRPPHPPRIRLLASQALAQIKEDDAIDALVDRLADPSPAVRQSAVESLVGRGEAAVSSLTTLLGDPNPLYWQGATEALVRIGQASVRPLIDAVQNYESAWQERAADVLVRLQGTAVPFLILGWTDPHATPDSRQRIDKIFARLGEAAVPTLSGYLTRTRDLVRLHAAISLGLMNHRAAAAAERLMAVGAKEEKPEIREAEAVAVVRVGSPQVVELAQTLREGGPGMRRFAAFVLGKKGTDARRAKPALIEALGNEDPQVRDEVETALVQVGRLDEQDLPFVEKYLQPTYHPRVRIRAAQEIERLARFNVSLRQPLSEDGGLMDLLNTMAAGDADPKIREAAGRLLDAIGEP